MRALIKTDVLRGPVTAVIGVLGGSFGLEPALNIASASPVQTQ